MKVSIQTLGSLGDVMPFITTAKQLEKLGATVSILAPRDYTTVIRGHGIHASEPPDFSLDLWNREAEQRGTLSGPLNFLRDWPDMVEPYVADIMEQSLHAAEGADVILANGICAPARLAAEHYKIPYLLHALQPVISPTSETPCAMVWRPWQGQILNKYGYGVVWIAQTFMERALRPHRKRLHLEDMPSFNQTRTHLNQPLPRISSISPCLMDQKPADWAENDFLLAYPSLEELPLDALPEDLRAFSAAGPPPVFVSLGSLEGETPIRLIDTIFSALEHLGLRAIVSDALASKLSSGRLAAHFVVGHVSHPPLFKLCSAIIHHGGAGTADTALRAGIPQIVVPGRLDQFWTAHRLQKIGVAPMLPSTRHLSEAAVCDALDFVHQPDTQSLAKRLATATRDRDGALELAELTLSETGRFRRNAK